MDSLLRPPTATLFDAISATTSGGIYLVVALLALARAPHDARVRVFLATAIAGIAPYGVTTLIWLRGSQAAFSKAVIVAVGTSLLLGSLALLHFTQVFPWRRPWIRAYGAWLWWGYAGVIAMVSVGAFATPSFDAFGSGSGGLGAVSENLAEVIVIVAIVVVVPLLILVGVVVPFAGLLSLYKSWTAARAARIESARVPTLIMLVSQMSGGVLTILIIPLLHLVAPTGPWVTIAAALLFGCSVLMPTAFAAGVWRYRVLDLPIDALPQ